MRFLVDAQLPPRLVAFLSSVGHDAIHVQSLVGSLRMSDAKISAAADIEGRVVVSKDADFRHSHTVSGTPAKLLLVVTGNIGNDDLVMLFEDRIDEVETAFGGADLIELHRNVLIVHGS